MREPVADEANVAQRFVREERHSVDSETRYEDFPPMGLMRFLVAPPNRISAETASRAYLVGPEQIPWVSRVHFAEGVVSVSRNESESASLCIPYPVAGRGELALTTGTLVERFAPYNLTVELARGKIHQLRGQIAEWQNLGITPKEQHLAALREATACLSRACTSQSDPAVAAEHAEVALRKAIDLADLVVARYVRKLFSVHRRAATPRGSLFGANLGTKLLRSDVTRPFLKAFNAAIVPLVWRDIEKQEGAYQWEIADRQIGWCKEHGIKVVAGPLLLLNDHGLPDWLALWQGDFDNILSFASDYVETAVQRYRGKVDVWLSASRINSGKALGLSDGERVRLAEAAVTNTRQNDPDTPAILGYDQPWAEYMALGDRDLSPLHFADYAVRSGLDFSGIGLELNVGYWPGGSYPRDAADFSRLVDRWGMLGMPLWMFLTIPSSQEADDKAFGRAVPVGGASAEGWSPSAQRRWLRGLTPLLLGKLPVQGVFYNQLCDGHRHEFASGGLVDAADAAKPGFSTLAKVRKKYLS